MLKFMGKKKVQFYAEIILLSNPVMFAHMLLVLRDLPSTKLRSHAPNTHAFADVKFYVMQIFTRTFIKS